MSLLGHQVFANPTTPLFAPASGGGGGSSNVVVPYNRDLIFKGSNASLDTHMAKNVDSTLTVFDPSGNFATLAVGDLVVRGTNLPAGGPFPVVFGLLGSNIELYGLDEDGAPASDYLVFTGGNLQLSNVSTINGSAYPPASGSGVLSRFVQSNSAGNPVLTTSVELAALPSFTPPVSGTALLTACGNFQLTASTPTACAVYLLQNGAGAFNSGVNVPPVSSNAYSSATSQWSFAVSGGTPYVFSANALINSPGRDGDYLAYGTSLSLMFVPS